MKKQINAGALNNAGALEEPQLFYIPLGRRRFFKSLAIASAGFTLPGYLAEALTLTPRLTQGPYYPLANNMPLDTTFHSACREPTKERLESKLERRIPESETNQRA